MEFLSPDIKKITLQMRSIVDKISSIIRIQDIYLILTHISGMEFPTLQLDH